MRKGLLTWAIALIGNFLWAQSGQEWIAPTQTPLERVQQYTLPKMDNEALMSDELARRQPGVAPRFAEAVEVSIRPETDGTWEQLPNGNWVWRIRIFSAKAKSLNLGFSRYEMPAGGSLILYSPDQEKVLGPFTPSDNEEHAQLWTPVLAGEAMIVEVQLPAAKRADLGLELSYINHDFLGFAQAMSGSCNLDVICGAADGWAIVDNYRDIIESVGVYGMNGTTFCTGFLVNNTAQDCTPFFMTANHCGVRPNNAASVVVYWNYEFANCRQPNTGPSGAPGGALPTQFNSGAIHRAGWGGSDFSLLELDDPVDESTEPFYAGWDASANPTGDSVVCIHHPNTDEKRISFEFDATSISNNGGGNYVVVSDWDVGTTEGGSSGSPLFNKSKRVIGQLLGGGAACGNNLSDSYGWMHRSWTGGGTVNTRLSDWLDPLGMGQLAIDGRSCGTVIVTSQPELSVCSPDDAVFNLILGSGFVDSVQLSVLNAPSGAVYSFSPNPVSPGGTTQLTLTNIGGLGVASYPFSVVGSDGMDSASLALTLNINSGVFQTQLGAPTHLAQLVNPSAIMNWIGTPGGTYQIQIATDSLFTMMVEDSVGVRRSTYRPFSLAEETTYFWRVQTTNACGTGDWSTTFSFKTGAFACQSEAASGLPIAISAFSANTITSQIQISQSGTIQDLNIRNLEVDHSFIEDLTISLTSPQGTMVTLMTAPDCPRDDLDLEFDDQAVLSYNDLLTTCNPGSPTISGVFQPQGRLSDFNGENIQGVWTLTIEDGFQQDGGALNRWDLEYCSIVESALMADPDTIVVCQGNDITLSLQLGAVFASNPGVFFNVNQLPPNAFFSLTPLPGQPNGTVDLTLSNLNTSGTFEIQIVGTDGTTSLTENITLTVQTDPVPVLLSPISSTNQMLLTPLLKWNSSGDSVRVEIALDAGFSQIIRTLIVQGDSVQLDSLDFGGIYYWRVWGMNSCGETVSESRELHTQWATSLEESMGIAVRLYPNPSQGKVNLDFSASLPQAVELTLWTLTGKALHHQVLPAGQKSVEIAATELPAGFYWVQLKGEGFSWSEKLLVTP